MQPLKKTPIYSKSNAMEVVGAFLEKYARATYFFAKMNRIDVYELTDHLLHYYMFNQKKWYAVKKAIKRISDDDQYFQNVADLREFLTFVKENYPLFVLNIEKNDPDADLVLDFCRIFEVDYITQEGTR